MKSFGKRFKFIEKIRRLKTEGIFGEEPHDEEAQDEYGQKDEDQQQDEDEQQNKDEQHESEDSEEFPDQEYSMARS